MAITTSGTTLTFNDSTTQTTAPVNTNANVTSATAVAGAGILISAVTTTGAATHTITGNQYVINEYNTTTTLTSANYGGLVTSNTTSSYTYTLPSLVAGGVISFSNLNTGTQTITTPSGAIFGFGVQAASSIVLPAYSSVQLATDGSNWKVLSSNAIQPTTGNPAYYGARAWVNFNGVSGSVAIRASQNISSVTRNGTGDYTVNITTAMPDANYAYNVSAGSTTSSLIITLNATGGTLAESAPTTSSFRFFINNGGNSAQLDCKYINVSLFR